MSCSTRTVDHGPPELQLHQGLLLQFDRSWQSEMNAILLMKRYAGESLGNSPRVVVLGSCKVGNFVVSTPLLRGLKERWPESTVDFIGSDITIDFETSCPWIDWRCSWDSSSANSGLALLQTLDERRACHGPVDLL